MRWQVTYDYCACTDNGATAYPRAGQDDHASAKPHVVLNDDVGFGEVLWKGNPTFNAVVVGDYLDVRASHDVTAYPDRRRFSSCPENVVVVDRRVLAYVDALGVPQQHCWPKPRVLSDIRSAHPPYVIKDIVGNEKEQLFEKRQRRSISQHLQDILKTGWPFVVDRLVIARWHEGHRILFECWPVLELRNCFVACQSTLVAKEMACLALGATRHGSFITR